MTYSVWFFQSLKISLLIILLIFIFGSTGSSLLCRRCSSWGERGLLSSCDTQASPWNGFSFCRAQAPGHSGFSTVARGLSSCSSQTLEHSLSSVAHGLSCSAAWGILGPGIQPMFPVLAGRFFTTEQSGKPQSLKVLMTVS